MMAGTPPPVSILTVGDGNLSYSLALARCFGVGEDADAAVGSAAVRLTATTYVGREELLATYAGAASNLAELEARGVTVRHGVDATARLCSDSGAAPGAAERFDHVIFSHPHLGLSDLHDTAAHARRHQVLVAHFLARAGELLRSSADATDSTLTPRFVHLGLCGRQPATWCAEPAAARLGLELVHTRPTASHDAFTVGRLANLPRAAPRPEWAARRRFRLGQLGSRHWLGDYGYEHKRTHSQKDMRVSNSVELVWSVGPATAIAAAVDTFSLATTTTTTTTTTTATTRSCPVCNLSWGSAAELATHVSASCCPDATFATPADMAASRAQIDAANAEETKKRALAKTKGIVCSHCGAAFPSRNKLFKHLNLECDLGGGGGGGGSGSLDEISTTERVVLLVGYLGTAFHGSAYSGKVEESVRPTVEGAVIAAATEVWTSVATFALTNLVVTVGSSARTERGTHCTSTLLVCTLKYSCERACRRAFLAIHVDRYAALAAALASRGVRVLAPPHRLEAAPAVHQTDCSDGGRNSKSNSRKRKKRKGGSLLFSDMRHIVRRRTYACAIPYAHLVTSAEAAAAEAAAAEASATPGATGPGEGDADEAEFWLSGFPPECDSDPAPILALLRAMPGASAVQIDITLASCGGNATVTVRTDAGGTGVGGASEWTAACVRALHGKPWPFSITSTGGEGAHRRTMIAIHSAEARIKMAVHKRVKRVLKQICVGGTSISASASTSASATQPTNAKRRKKNPARSFHNLTSDKKVAKSAVATMRKSLMRCSSGLHEDIDISEPSSSSSSLSSSTPATWVASTWLVVHMSAKNFLPEQVRRMVGVLVAVVSGDESLDFVDLVFRENTQQVGHACVCTAAAPAAAFWLDHVGYAPGVDEYLAAHALSGSTSVNVAATAAAVRADIVSEVVRSKEVRRGFSRMIKEIRFHRHVRESWAWFDSLGCPKWWCAPMVGASEPAFRLLVRSLGVHICSTEMIDSGGFANSAEYRKQFFAAATATSTSSAQSTSSSVAARVTHDRPLIVQLGGANRDHLLRAAVLAAPLADAVELNVGCPQQCARKAQPPYGAFMMNDPDTLVDLVQALAATLRECNPPTPLLCKIRVYKDTDATVALAQRLERAGCACLTVHGRTRHDKGKTGSKCRALADWGKIAAVKSALRIPVVGNGNVRVRSDAEAMLRDTGCDAVMSGCGLLVNPALFFEPSPGGDADGVDVSPVGLALRYLECCSLCPPFHVTLSKHVTKILGPSLLDKYPHVRELLLRHASRRLMRASEKGARKKNLDEGRWDGVVKEDAAAPRFPSLEDIVEAVRGMR